MSHQFILHHHEELSDIGATVRIYRHQSGATLLSVANDDENKCFGATFRTMPANSNGVAHILEHSVLCGSKRYPVKSPFNELLKGSVNTFLNAMTYPDKTVYPVASTNLKDLYNLVSVYMDAVFHPLITEDTLRQEGWRYEFDEDGKLVYKGIVYNEMKGASATADRISSRALYRELMPDTIYANDSGGDPRAIPMLSYEEFVDFHRTYYHPSNCLLYWYGDDDEAARLAHLEPFLREFEATTPPPPIAPQPKWDAPRRAQYTYPASAEEQRAHVTLAWLIDEELNEVEQLELSILDHALLDDPTSPLHQRMLDSNLGERLSGGGFGFGKQVYFALGLKGVAPENIDKVAPLVRQSIAEIAEIGIERAQIDASINTLEFQIRENNTGGFPRGLALMLNITEPWLQGKDLLSGLRYNSLLRQVKELLNDEQRVRTILQRMLLTNPHQLELVVVPDATMNDQLDAQEAAELTNAETTLDAQARQAINESAERLQQWQETPDSPEALAQVPRLGRNDIEPDVKRTPLEHGKVGDVTLTMAPLFTSGIVYVDFGFDITQIPHDLLPYIPLYNSILIDVGAGQYDSLKLAQNIGTYTGGIGISSSSGLHRTTRAIYGNMFVRGKALPEHVPTLLELMREIVVAPHLHNKERIMQIVREDKARREAGVLPSGHSYINTRLRAGLSLLGGVSEITSGATYVTFIRNLAGQGDAAWPEIHAKLSAIQQHLVKRGGMRVHVTANPELLPQIQQQIGEAIAIIPTGAVTSSNWQGVQLPRYEALQVPAQVNYVGVGGSLSSVGYICDGADIVVNRHLSRTFLHEHIREQGGAYGAFSVLEMRTGNLTMLSYRDPNLLKTLETYRKAGQWLSTVHLDDDALLQAIIGAAGDLDGHQLPDARGFGAMARHLSGDDDDYRQQIRNQALAVENAHFARLGQAIMAMSDHWRIVVLGGESAIRAAQAEQATLFEQITPIL